MNATGAQNNESNNGARQSFVTPFSNDPERYWERPDYTKVIADTAINQICGSLKAEHGPMWPSVLASWGCVSGTGITGKLLRWRDMPALALHVSGYKHTGWVIVSLNEGADVYELELADEQMFAIEGSRLEEVYFDELGPKIDAMVETGGNEDEYNKQVEQDPANADIIALRKRFPNAKQVVVL